MIFFYNSEHDQCYFTGGEFWEIRRRQYGAFLTESCERITWQHAYKICERKKEILTEDGKRLVERLGQPVFDEDLLDFGDAGTVEQALRTPKKFWPHWLRDRMQFIEEEYQSIMEQVNAYKAELETRDVARIHS